MCSIWNIQLSSFLTFFLQFLAKQRFKQISFSSSFFPPSMLFFELVITSRLSAGRWRCLEGENFRRETSHSYENEHVRFQKKKAFPFTRFSAINSSSIVSEVLLSTGCFCASVQLAAGCQATVVSEHSLQQRPSKAAW